MDWISAKDRLPEGGLPVLMYYERYAWRSNRLRIKEIGVGWQYEGKWHVDGCSGVAGIAWMPLPEPPKEVK